MHSRWRSRLVWMLVEGYEWATWVVLRNIERFYCNRLRQVLSFWSGDGQGQQWWTCSHFLLLGQGIQQCRRCFAMIRGKVKSQVLMSTSKPRSILGLIILSTTTKVNKNIKGWDTSIHIGVGVQTNTWLEAKSCMYMGFYSYLYLYFFVDNRSVHERFMSHGGAGPCSSGARRCNAVWCCVHMVTSLLVPWPSSIHFLLSPFMVIDK